MFVKLFTKIGYWIPPYIVSQIYRLKLLDINDYDKHYNLIFKTLPFTHYLLLKILLDLNKHPFTIPGNSRNMSKQNI